MTTPNIKVLVLAAGASTRLGSPKQLLEFNGEQLLTLTLNKLQQFDNDCVFTILGANATHIKEKSTATLNNLLHNPNWEEGMGNTIAFGIEHITRKYPNLDGILVTTCDLPLITASDYFNITQLLTTPQQIVASVAQGTLCPPVLFGKDYFNELKQLNGQKGAKAVINKHLQHIVEYPNSRAASDVDTLSDLRKL